jgi:hypothetical protein
MTLPIVGAPERVRLADLRYKSIVVRPDGFEPPTPWFEARYSIQLSYGRPARSVAVASHFGNLMPAPTPRNVRTPDGL